MAEDVIAPDARALEFIQRADSDEIFPRVANQETAKTAWISKNLEVIHMTELRNYKVFERDFGYSRMRMMKCCMLI